MTAPYGYLLGGLRLKKIVLLLIAMHMLSKGPVNQKKNNGFLPRNLKTLQKSELSGKISEKKKPDNHPNFEKKR